MATLQVSSGRDVPLAIVPDLVLWLAAYTRGPDVIRCQAGEENPDPLLRAACHQTIDGIQLRPFQQVTTARPCCAAIEAHVRRHIDGLT